MPVERPVIDLVAVAYQAPGETERFLASLDKVGVPFTLTVVENASPDPDVLKILDKKREYVEAIPECLEYTVLAEQYNFGYAKACNLGASLRKDSAKYLALLNCDIKFEEDCVEKIVAHFESHPQVGIVGPRTTTSDGRLTHAGIIRMPNGHDQHRAWLEPDNLVFTDTLQVPTVSGATYFVRRLTWDELTECKPYQEAAGGALGAFLPTSHFYEETFCSYHAYAHGWLVNYLGSAKMIHEWHRSSPVGSVSLSSTEAFFRRACMHHGIELTF